jgi:hypothetical protein
VPGVEEVLPGSHHVGGVPRGGLPGAREQADVTLARHVEAVPALAAELAALELERGAAVRARQPLDDITQHGRSLGTAPSCRHTRAARAVASSARARNAPTRTVSPVQPAPVNAGPASQPPALDPP